MTLTPSQLVELKEAVKPLLIFNNKHFHPHVKVIVDQNDVEVVEGVTHFQLNDYLID